jgi:tetratricopeptide (TPR) repeat protein
MRTIFLSIREVTVIAAVLLSSILICAPRSSAQYQQQQQQPSTKPATPSGQAAPANGAQPTAEAPKPVDSAEESAYKAFADTKPEDADKRIQLGEQYAQKYPNGRYLEVVYSQLTNAEYNKQDMPKMYADADKALALNPDDVTVLTLVGWVIPHSYDPNDIEADRKLEKAEQYEKHALTLLTTLPKPPNMTDDQFAKAKAQAQSEAHSGLGLVYFRRQKYSEAVDEFKQSIASSETPDPTDYYVMGVCLTHLSRFSDAIDSFQKCAQIAGGLQDRCKQMVDQTKKQAATSLEAPK